MSSQPPFDTYATQHDALSLVPLIPIGGWRRPRSPGMLFLMVRARFDDRSRLPTQSGGSL